MTREEIVAQNEELIRCYRTVFATPAGQKVLADLGNFCFAGGTPFSVNRGETDRNVGRNEVYRRITDYAHFTLDEIYTLRRGGTITLDGETDGE